VRRESWQSHAHTTYPSTHWQAPPQNPKDCGPAPCSSNAGVLWHWHLYPHPPPPPPPPHPLLLLLLPLSATWWPTHLQLQALVRIPVAQVLIIPTYHPALAWLTLQGIKRNPGAELLGIMQALPAPRPRGSIQAAQLSSAHMHKWSQVKLFITLLTFLLKTKKASTAGGIWVHNQGVRRWAVNSCQHRLAHLHKVINVPSPGITTWKPAPLALLTSSLVVKSGEGGGAGPPDHTLPQVSPCWSPAWPPGVKSNTGL
jgi:hypothetical protein